MMEQLVYTRSYPHIELNNGGRISKDDGFGVFSTSEGLLAEPSVTNNGFLFSRLAAHHVSFRIMKGNEDIAQVARSASYVKREDPVIKQAKKNSMHIKCALDSWSDDPLPSYLRKFFSNTQHKRFFLNYPDIVGADNRITLAFRCVTRPNYTDRPISFSYSIKLELVDEALKNGDFCLYEELSAINHLEVIDEGIAEIEANI